LDPAKKEWNTGSVHKFEVEFSKLKLQVFMLGEGENDIVSVNISHKKA